LAKLDRRPLNVGFAPFVTNSAQTMRGLFVEFEKTTEFERVRDITVNHMIRRGGKPFQQ
jgi:hypothetical protein